QAGLGMHRVAQITKLIAFLILLAGAITMIVPFIWMFDTSVKTPGEIFLYPPRWIPSEWRWQNYSEALTVLPFGQWFFNTTYITLVASLGQVLSASLVGYAFARLRAPGRDFLFIMVISTMLLPEQVTMVPVFLIFRSLNWIDTWNPLIVPAWLGGGAFFIFLCRQFFMTIPLELDDAAKIDGCGTLRIFWQIILPLSKPVLAAVTVFSVVGRWNEFLYPVIYLNSQEKYVVSIGLRLFRDLDTTSWNWLMAASVVTMLPCLVIFFFAQKLFVQGIATTGIKG
ncbi:MAG TPA: carbohydrate ABC transporter permease, partial [Chloroflexota bacterium]|nr:carbohydrate ABC transporter permease [Chloroflexota bacterium]